MRSPVIHRTTLHSGGATSPTVELYQRANGRCRLWAYWFDQDGQQSETIASFHEPNWANGFISLCRDPLFHTEPLPKSYVLRFMITYAIIMSMTYAYEIVRQYYQDMMELKHDLLMKEKEKLSILARTDYLTKLSNRQYITELIAYERGRAKRSNKSYSIAIGDIDNFKAVNDSYGHDCGDMVLKKIADIMRSTVRHQDYVARWGGEEFLLLLPETDSIGARTVAEKIRADVENVSFQCLGSSFSITMSFGVSQLHGIAEDMQETIKNADRALYRAKNAGKNIVIIDD